MKRLTFLLIPALVLLPAAAAHAQAIRPPEATPVEAPPPPPPVSAFETFGMHGFEVEIGTGVMSGGGDSPVQAPTLWGAAGNAVGGPQSVFPRGTLIDPGGAAALGQYYSAYSVDPGAFWARVGYRLRRDLSVGVFFSFAQYNVNPDANSGDSADFTSNLARQQVSVGAYVRYYFTRWLIPRLQPWVSLGLGYNYDGASYSRPIGQATNAQPETGDYILQQHGLVVPAAIGLDVRLAPWFALGPTVGYARVIPLKGCIEVDTDQFSQLPGQNTCASPPVQNQGYDNFYAGIYAKMTFDPFAR